MLGLPLPRLWLSADFGFQEHLLDAFSIGFPNSLGYIVVHLLSSFFLSLSSTLPKFKTVVLCYI